MMTPDPLELTQTLAMRARSQPRTPQTVAVEFEAVILAEFLRAAGVGKPLEGFGGGGIGEAQLASQLVDLQARAIAARGGLGLAEMVIRATARGDEATQ